MRADTAVRPKARLDIGIGGGFVVECGSLKMDLVTPNTPHAATIYLVHGHVKYNIAFYSFELGLFNGLRRFQIRIQESHFFLSWASPDQFRQ